MAAVVMAAVVMAAVVMVEGEGMVLVEAEDLVMAWAAAIWAAITSVRTAKRKDAGWFEIPQVA